MTAQVTPTPIFREVDNNGNALVGGQLFTYAAGTTTPQATYTDSTQTTQNTNPVILNSRGEAQVWLNPALAYKLNLLDQFGNQIPGYPVDNINGAIVPTGNLIPSQDNTFTLGSSSFSWANIYLGPNHAPAFDTVSGNIVYYGQTAAEIAASVVPTNFAFPELNLRRYGADNTGVQASDAAMTAAIAVAGSNGGIIRAPSGVYLFNNQINWVSKTGIILQGDGACTSGAAPDTVIRYNGTGGNAAILATGSTGCGLRNIQWMPLQTGFAGSMVQLGANVTNASFFTAIDCVFGSISNTVCTYFALDTSQECFFQRCNFIAGGIQIKGQNSGGGSYSNVMTFRDCQFAGSSSTPIAWGGESWSFDGCTFEGVGTGTVLAGAFTSLSTTPCLGMSFRGCWFGDVTGNGGTWITFFGAGLSVNGCRFGGNAASNAISLNDAPVTSSWQWTVCGGIDIRGSTFDTFNIAISFDTSPFGGVAIQDNIFKSVTTVLGGSSPPSTLVYNPNFPTVVPATGLNVGKITTNGYQINPNGLVTMWGSLSVTSGTPVAVTFSSNNGIAFPNNVFSIVASINAPGASGNVVSTTSTSVTGTTFSCTGSGGNTVYWQATGN